VVHEPSLKHLRSRATRLAPHSEELAALRASPEVQKFATLRSAQRRHAQTAAEVVPEGAGDWTFYYDVPEDGSSLIRRNMKRKSMSTMQEVYRDERTVAAYRNSAPRSQPIMPRSSSPGAGWYDGDDACAHAAQQILLEH